MAFLEFLSTSYGLIIAIVSLIALGGLGAFIYSRRSSSRELPTPPKRHELPASEDGEPKTEDDAVSGGEAVLLADEAFLADSVEDSDFALGEEESFDEEPVAVEEPETLALDVPESLPSRMERLRGRLARSGSLGKALLSVLSRGELSATDWEELEDTLLMADLGLEATEELMEALRTRVKVSGTQNSEEVRGYLREELLALVGPDMDRSLNLERHPLEDGTNAPATVLMVGVNGTGKTTTVGKLARILVAEGHSVLLGAADTFRAAAAEQLGTWGERVGVDVIRSDREGADPASVAFDAVKAGKERGVEIVLVDTAGRLQNKSTLMDELGKVKRVMERQSPTNEVLLVLDATTGQNGMRQAEVFAEAVGVTGIVLTKLDGSAKGGIVVSVQRALGVPVKFVGLGEGVDDLAPFHPADFVDAIVNS